MKTTGPPCCELENLGIQAGREGSAILSPLGLAHVQEKEGGPR